MFVTGVEIISSKLNNITLDQFNMRNNMHPNDGSPVCGKNQLPVLHLTPSNSNQKRPEGGSPVNNPYLLKPQHDIPATPPPRTERKSENLFLQRFG